MKKIIAFILVLATLLLAGCSIKRETPYHSSSPYVFDDINEFVSPEFTKNSIALCQIIDVCDKREIKDFENFDKGFKYYYPLRVEVIESYCGFLEKGEIIYIYSNGKKSSEEYFDLKKGFRGILNICVVPEDVREEFLSGALVYNYFGNKKYVLELDENDNVLNKENFGEKDFYYGIDNLLEAETLLKENIGEIDVTSEEISPEITPETTEELTEEKTEE